MSKRNSRESRDRLSRPARRRLMLLVLLGCAVIGAVSLWLIWPDLNPHHTEGPVKGSEKSADGALREDEVRAEKSNGLASSTSSSAQDPARPEGMKQRVDGSAGRLELEPPSAISVDPECRRGDWRQSGSGSPLVNVITAQEMVSEATTKLEANQEFPARTHVVRWEMAFGLPEPGVLFWAEWSGERPARYRIYVQDARTPQSSWDAAGKAPIEQRAQDLSWSDAIEVLKDIKNPLVGAFGPASYRRLIVTDAIPIDPDETSSAGEKSATLSVEVLGPRILAFSRSGVSCSRVENSAMHCSCAQPHVHK